MRGLQGRRFSGAGSDVGAVPRVALCRALQDGRGRRGDAPGASKRERLFATVGDDFDAELCWASEPNVVESCRLPVDLPLIVSVKRRVVGVPACAAAVEGLAVWGV